ncbi:MAG: MarC family protein [Bacteroidaceae bacterium]|jgi:multiple antibiotic resistance protein
MLEFDFQQMFSAFIVLFAVIDILGATPIILDLREKGRSVNALKATLISFALMVLFFYVGDGILRLFRVDIESFAVAGAILLFLISLEMLLDIEIFKSNAPLQSATLIPLVFPLLAGAGTFTTLLSLRAEYSACNILIALALNMVCVYCVIRSTTRIEQLLSKAGIYLIRKFFGIILMAISVRLFTTNIVPLMSSLWK